MAIEVHKNDDKHRFEISVDGRQAGFADYTVTDQTYAMPHTEVFAQFGGAGIGSQLVVESLKIIASEGAEVLPYCPFIPTVIVKHPEFIELVPEAERTKFALATPQRSES